MKIRETSAVPAKPPAAAEEKTAGARETKFSKVLAKKRPPAEPPAQAPPPAVPFSERPLAAVRQAEAPAAPHAPLLLQGLVQEIVVVARPDGRQEVEIQFDSKTFAGLRVTIAQEGEGVRIRFTSRSPEVSAMLAANSGQLTHALANHGIPVVALRFENATPARGEPRSGGREQRGGGREGQRR